jgi:predicted AlkP superfamily phosphohydrolase/phosphomutase
MTLHVGGWQLLPEILVRLGYSSAGSVAGSIRSRLPAPARRVIKGAIRGPLKDRLKTASGTPAHPLENPKTKAAWVRCGGNGAIRLNVRGRDPYGSIEPGDEYDEVCADLTSALEALTDTGSGEPVVSEVVRSDEVFGDRYHPNLPDLIVRYRHQGVITSVTSPRIGTVAEEARDAGFARSGEHTSRVRLWHVGPGAPARETIPGGHVLDVSPTVLARLGVPLPETLDGKPLHRGEPALA